MRAATTAATAPRAATTAPAATGVGATESTVGIRTAISTAAAAILNNRRADPDRLLRSVTPGRRWRVVASRLRRKARLGCITSRLRPRLGCRLDNRRTALRLVAAFEPLPTTTLRRPVAWLRSEASIHTRILSTTGVALRRPVAGLRSEASIHTRILRATVVALRRPAVDTNAGAGCSRLNHAAGSGIESSPAAVRRSVRREAATDREVLLRFRLRIEDRRRYRVGAIQRTAVRHRVRWIAPRGRPR